MNLRFFTKDVSNRKFIFFLVVMENPWLSVDSYDSDDFEDGNSNCFLGVFNRPPSQIALSLERPQTPFVPRNFGFFNFQNAENTAKQAGRNPSSILARNQYVEVY